MGTYLVITRRISEWRDSRPLVVGDEWPDRVNVACNFPRLVSTRAPHPSPYTPSSFSWTMEWTDDRKEICPNGGNRIPFNFLQVTSNLSFLIRMLELNIMKHLFAIRAVHLQWTLNFACFGFWSRIAHYYKFSNYRVLLLLSELPILIRLKS